MAPTTVAPETVVPETVVPDTTGPGDGGPVDAEDDGWDRPALTARVTWSRSPDPTAPNPSTSPRHWLTTTAKHANTTGKTHRAGGGLPPGPPAPCSTTPVAIRTHRATVDDRHQRGPPPRTVPSLISANDQGIAPATDDQEDQDPRPTLPLPRLHHLHHLLRHRPRHTLAPRTHPHQPAQPLPAPPPDQTTPSLLGQFALTPDGIATWTDPTGQGAHHPPTNTLRTSVLPGGVTGTLRASGGGTGASRAGTLLPDGPHSELEFHLEHHTAPPPGHTVAPVTIWRDHHGRHRADIQPITGVTLLDPTSLDTTDPATTDTDTDTTEHWPCRRHPTPATPLRPRPTAVLTPARLASAGRTQGLVVWGRALESGLGEAPAFGICSTISSMDTFIGRQVIQLASPSSTCRRARGSRRCARRTGPALPGRGPPATGAIRDRAVATSTGHRSAPAAPARPRGSSSRDRPMFRLDATGRKRRGQARRHVSARSTTAPMPRRATHPHRAVTELLDDRGAVPARLPAEDGPITSDG